ncbi:MAG TPA: hypothetical protein VFK16_06780 [Gemmatimonadaceae bacterium]|nr:hypothetical protein [Gemmatimonadaceae bacterium]
MSDDSLAKRIAAVGGRVVIGVHEPNAPVALDEAARTPVSPATLEAAKTWMRSNGVNIGHEYKSVPAVVATINPNQVAALRANPRIEYVEPIEPIHPTVQDTGYGVFKVGAPNVWPSSTGSGVRVMVIGTGAQTNSDLSWADIRGGTYHASFFGTHFCVADNGVDSVTTGLDAGHETAVAGVIGALDNSIGTKWAARTWDPIRNSTHPNLPALGHRSCCSCTYARRTTQKAQLLSVSRRVPQHLSAHPEHSSTVTVVQTHLHTKPSIAIDANSAR